MGLAWFWVAPCERKQPLRLMANQFRPRQRGNSELKRPSRLRLYGQTSRRSLYAFFVFLVRASQQCGWGLFRPWLPLDIFFARPYQLFICRESAKEHRRHVFFQQESESWKPLKSYMKIYNPFSDIGWALDPCPPWTLASVSIDMQQMNNINKNVYKLVNKMNT